MDASGSAAEPSRFKTDTKSILLKNLTPTQAEAVDCPARRLLLIAGAGSGKTEVMARRVAWWVAVDGVPRDSIVAFTFTERAAEEMKFRIRRYIQQVTAAGQDATLGGMYVGTIHGFCVALLRQLAPDEYHNYDVIDDAGRMSLVQRGYYYLLGLQELATALGKSQYNTIETFLHGYDLLNEWDELDVDLCSEPLPTDVAQEKQWCKEAGINTDVGTSAVSRAFGKCAARYYSYLRSRRFLDFSTSQTELLRLLKRKKAAEAVRSKLTRVVVDEVQDINTVQDRLIRKLVGDTGYLTAVGDHRQAIFGWRGGRVELMGKLYKEFKADSAARLMELSANFRSASRIIAVANTWARSIGTPKPMTNPDMLHGRKKRADYDGSHVAALTFPSWSAEAEWIATTIKQLVRADGTGAKHDTDNEDRGLSYADVAVLIRTSKDARTYMNALEGNGIPAVFRAGPDLFSQPEVLLFVGALARMGGVDEFLGSPNKSKSLPVRIKDVLGCDPKPESVMRAACKELRRIGLTMGSAEEKRLLRTAELIHKRIAGEPISKRDTRELATPGLVNWLTSRRELRRIFPQTLFQWCLAEAGVGDWEQDGRRGATALFHLGALSALVKGIETPGWTTPGDLKYQVIALYQWGAENGRTEEAPLLVAPDAVTISTIHAAKGLEYSAVFLADVSSYRFPGARRSDPIPFDGPVLPRIDPASLIDNDNYDQERRLMYVALTRAERYLFVSSSRPSKFFDAVAGHMAANGGFSGKGAAHKLRNLSHAKTQYRRDIRLATSFSDLRYYLACPHDFYLRKVLGFAPTIDQAFGYGRAVHNLMRAIHSDPKIWAKLKGDNEAIKAKVQELIDRGLFYLRYTTGDPAQNMREKAKNIIVDYIEAYADEELSKLEFEPEKPFETLIEEEQVLISGAIDVVRLDDPPRVALIDFKSGEEQSETTTLNEDEMRLQVSLYGLAARHELEYEPDRGVVRYLGDADGKKHELQVVLDDAALKAARETVVKAARQIRERQFDSGPTRPKGAGLIRCATCDHVEFCGRGEAKDFRKSR